MFSKAAAAGKRLAKLVTFEWRDNRLGRSLYVPQDYLIIPSPHAACMYLQQTTFENIVGRRDIAHDEQYLLMPYNRFNFDKELCIIFTLSHIQQIGSSRHRKLIS